MSRDGSHLLLPWIAAIVAAMMKRTVLPSLAIPLVISLAAACWAAGAKGPGSSASTRPRKTATGADYMVGPGQDYPRLGDVPWEALDPGATIRIFWREAPYNEKFLINRSGTGFTGTAGDARTYDEGAACVRVQKGAHITFRHNEISDCDNGLFSQSQEDWNVAKNTANKVNLTADILIDGNYLHDCGAATGRSTDRHHNSYIQSVGVVYQYNHYGRQRPGARGSALKDRSIGTVVRFNRFEGCARSLDLVEAENTPLTALREPAYGESFFRQGTLYFYSNTVIIDAAGEYGSAIFQISTTQEHAQIFNNVLWISGGPRYIGLLGPTHDLGRLWTDGGTVNLGVNLFNDGWIVNPDRGANHASHAVVSGKEKM